MKKLIGSLLLWMMLVSIPAFAMVADFESVSKPVEAYGLDTVAGFSTVLRTSKLGSAGAVKFAVKKPNNEVVYVDAKAGANGVVIADLSDYYTHLAGQYAVKLLSASGQALGKENSFMVYPGQVSLSKSVISPKEKVVSGDEVVNFTVKLTDDFGNAISGHRLKLISNSGSGEVKALGSDLSDEDGLVKFLVSSVSDGVYYYSVYDLTADEVLDARSKVVFLEGNAFHFNDTKPVTAAFGNSSGPVDHLEFDFPDQINPGAPISVTLKALDAQDEPVLGYLGKVRFSVAGANAAYVDVPEDYMFTADDQGEHTFSLAVNFNRVGEYDIRATDLDNLSIFADEKVTVTQGSSLDNNVPDAKSVRITSPLPGTYGNNVQVITGVASPGTGLKIFDNELELKTVIADLDGQFTYTTGALSDGDHTIYAAVVNELGTITELSKSVKFTIDTKVPDVTDVQLDPADKVIPGSAVKIQFKVSDVLTSATLIVNGVRTDLNVANDGLYSGSFAAPIEFGDYQLALEIVDELGNKSKIDDIAKVTVAALDLEKKTPPPVVENLVVRSEDRRAILNWSAVNSTANPVVRYRVYYGLAPNALTNAVDTFTTEPMWYLPNLVNGQTYYFAVVAVDSQSVVSANFSNIVSAVPGPLVVDMPGVDVVEGTGGADDLNHLDRDVAEAGPEVTWLLFLSALVGYSYMRVSRRRIQVARLRADVRKDLSDCFLG